MRGSMIKAIIFDLDDTLFDFKRAHVEGMKAWAAYAEQQFHLAPDETISEVSALVKVQAEKIGPLAASHNRVLRAELWLEQHGLPLFPHATALAERYWEALIAAAEPTEVEQEVISARRTSDRTDPADGGDSRNSRRRGREGKPGRKAE